MLRATPSGALTVLKVGWKINGETMTKLKRCLGLVFLSLACMSLEAQTVQGVVAGIVTDPTGAIVPGASVTLTNEGTNVVQEDKTGRNGEFRFSLVPPGTYSVGVKATGFNERQIKGIIVNPSQTVPVEVTLSVATASTTVDVTTAVPLVQTATSDLATTVNTLTIESTPLIQRNIFDLAFLAPAVSQGMNFGPASGGARESGTGFLLNGADNNNNFS